METIIISFAIALIVSGSAVIFRRTFKGKVQKMKKETIVYKTAWKKPFKYYTNFVWCWYHYLKNSKNLSKKDELKKLVYQEEMKRINV